MGTISKVRDVQGKGFFDGKFGRMYKFSYSMEDGTVLEANHKTEDGFFNVGSEVEYSVTRESEQYGKSGKVGKPQDEQYQNNGGQQAPLQQAPLQQAPSQRGNSTAPPAGRRNETQADKNRAFALSYSKDLFVPVAESYANNNDLARDVVNVAEQFLTFLNK